MILRKVMTTLGVAALLAVPAALQAQTVDASQADAARGVGVGQAGGVAAPADTTDQLRLKIWADNAARKQAFDRAAAEQKAAVAAYQAEVARVAVETARIGQEDAARQAAYAAEVAAYEAKLAACHDNGARGCRWPSPPPRRHN